MPKPVHLESARIIKSVYKTGRTEEGSKEVKGSLQVLIDLGDEPGIVNKLAALGKTVQITVDQLQTELYGDEETEDE